MSSKEPTTSFDKSSTYGPSEGCSRTLRLLQYARGRQLIGHLRDPDDDADAPLVLWVEQVLDLLIVDLDVGRLHRVRVQPFARDPLRLGPAKELGADLDKPKRSVSVFCASRGVAERRAYERHESLVGAVAELEEAGSGQHQ